MSKRLLWIALLAFSYPSVAQTTNTDNPTKLDYAIPSPNTSEFEKFGTIPVNKATGVPNISVPIYTIKAGKYTLPLGISYHAGGIRVDDISSDVGLGWNLNAGYKITRVLRGKPDESGFVGHNDAAKITPTIAAQSVDNNADTFKAVADGIWDTQPDEFNFNIGSASGKFILSPDKVIVIPDQDIRVSYSTATGAHYQFVLTDAKGIQYHFNDFSISNTESCQDGGATLDYASGWPVSKIIYPDTKDSIVFNYITEMQSLSNVSETRNYDYELTPRPVKTKICEVITHTFEKKIASIYFPDGKVVFTYAQPRYEIPGTFALSNIQLFNTSNELNRTFKLGYNYYNDISSNGLAKKLRLDSVYTITPDNTVTGKYNFQYNTGDIPAYGSLAKDHWGFYNGQSNASLIPGNTYTLYDGNGLSFYVPGGNRDVVPSEAVKGTLNKITYPTGGYTMFEFESNDAGKDCNGNGNVSVPIYTYTKFSSFSSCKFINLPRYQTDTTFFTAPSTQQLTIQVERNTWTCTGNTKNFVLIDRTTNQVVAQGLQSISRELVSGHNYALVTEADCRNAEANMFDCEDRIRATITFQNTVGYNKNKYVGGLRVKQITDYDQYSNVSNVRTYSYRMPNEPDRSSGLLTFMPAYDYMYYYVEQSGYPIYQFKTVTSYAFTSQANNTAQNNDGAVIYEYVKETIGSAGEGGSILSRYSIPYRSCNLSYPFAPFTSYAHRNGLLLSTDIYDKNGVLKGQATNSYSFKDGGSVEGWKTAYQKVKSTAQPHDIFTGIKYKYVSEKIRLDSALTRRIYPNDDQLQKQYYSYTNDDSYYPYMVSSRNSQGQLLASISYRASDFNVATSGNLTGMAQALQYMLTNHLTDYPVENYNLVDGKVTGGSIYEYFFYDNIDKQYLFPSTIFNLRIGSPIGDYDPLNRTINSNAYTLDKDKRYFPEMSYRGFNEKGMYAIMKADGQQSLSLIWGYGGNFPIASVTGDSLYRCAYTSFEPDAQGNWNFHESDVLSSGGFTGKRCYPLSNGDVIWNQGPIPGMSAPQSTGTPIAGNYIVSYWKRNGDVLVNGTAASTTGATANGWTYCEHRIYNPTGVTVNGNATIDELRFYAAGNTMKSFTYEPLKGMTSGDNGSGHVSFFEYDQLGRLIQVKDEQGNIVKRNTYQYQGSN